MEPKLYILMRSDMDSLNPGKAMAQASHATSQFEHAVRTRIVGGDSDIANAYERWRGEGGGFGTTIVLDVGGGGELKTVVEHYQRSVKFLAGITVDPTYPILDGRALHTLSIETCGYVFTPGAGFSGSDTNVLDGLALYA